MAEVVADIDTEHSGVSGGLRLQAGDADHVAAGPCTVAEWGQQGIPISSRGKVPARRICSMLYHAVCR